MPRWTPKSGQYDQLVIRRGFDPSAEDADTWEQLRWMARGAAPFERGGRLWARDNTVNAVLYMADLHSTRNPFDTEAATPRTNAARQREPQKAWN